MVSDQFISTEMWTAVRAAIVAGAPEVTDGSSTLSASVRASYNDEETSKPQIIIYPIDLAETKDKFNITFGKRNITVNIDCYYSKSLGVDQLKDQVNYILSTTYIVGVELQSSSSDYSFAEIGESKYHLSALVFNYTKE